MEFVDQSMEVFRKYRVKEPHLWPLRCCTIVICVGLLITYGVFLLIFLTTDNPVEQHTILPAPTIPAADIKLTWQYKFNMTCEFVYADGTHRQSDWCEKLITEPCCCQQQNSSDKLFRGYFTAWNDTYNLQYSVDTGLYGIWFNIIVDDVNFSPDQDLGMVLRAYDSEFNPMTLTNYQNKTVRSIDADFYNSLEDLNYHVIGYQQNNWMFINRKIKEKLWPGGRNVIGIPPKHFQEPFLDTDYESVNNPIYSGNNTGPLYANLFVGTLNWYQEEITERRGRSLLDCLGLIAGFYALLIGVYICCFGAPAILPWGFCQLVIFRRRTREDLREDYKPDVPLLDAVGGAAVLSADASDEERLAYYTTRFDNLERFLKAYVVNVDYLEDDMDEVGAAGMYYEKDDAERAEIVGAGREAEVSRQVELDREVEVSREVELDREVEVSREIEVDREVEVEIDREIEVDREVEVEIDREVEVSREIEVDREVEVEIDREVEVIEVDKEVEIETVITKKR